MPRYLVSLPRRDEHSGEHNMNMTLTTHSETLTNMLNFARSHDWGKNALIPYASSALHIYDEDEDEIVKFTDMLTLRAWAGY
jgi:hypothetical protein